MIETPRAKFNVADFGTGEPAFVFPHYWGGSDRTWAPVMERL
jgi:hypothetical protein